MLCGFGSDLANGRLPFVLHPAVLPKLQQVAQRLGLPTPSATEPPSPNQSIPPTSVANNTNPQLAAPLISIEPLILTALAMQQQQQQQQQQQLADQQMNPATKALLALLFQQQAARSLLSTLNLQPEQASSSNSSPSTAEPNGPMDFSPIIASADIHQQFGHASSSSSVDITSPGDVKASSPVSSERRLGHLHKTHHHHHHHHHDRTPNRRSSQAPPNLLSNASGLMVQGEPIECLPAYAKLANTRWSHKQSALHRQQQQQPHQQPQNANTSALNNSDEMATEPSPNCPADETSPTSGCMHVCIFCGKRYSRKYGLKIHLRTHTGYRPLECRYCHRRFGDPSNLNKHLRLHAQVESPFVCKFCGKSLVRRRDLDRHLRSRHPGMVAPTVSNQANTPSGRPQQQSRCESNNNMVFPSRGISPTSSVNSPTH